MTDAAARYQEKVLPSGAFARLPASLKGKHFILAQGEAKLTGQDVVWTLIAQNLTIDGESVTYEQLMDRDLRDVMEINSMLNATLEGPVKP